MDQKKIGKYIANKRKALGLTQVQLAEKLGMSNKSVSKWERGVCLPDVSVYEKLCGTLGISLNEFLAGEDLLDAEIIPKSEETIISITTENKRSRRRANMLALLMGIIVLTIFSIIVGPLAEELDEDEDGFFDGGHIVPLHADSSEVQMANLLREGEIRLYRYDGRRGSDHMQICCYWYKDGYLMDESTLLSYVFSGEHYGEGLIAIIDDYDTGSLAFEVTLEGKDHEYGPDGSACDRFELPLEGQTLQEWQENYTRFVYAPQEKMRIDYGDQGTGLLVMAYDESSASEISDTMKDLEFWPKVRDYCPEIADHDYTVFITAKFWNGESLSEEAYKTPMEYIKTFHESGEGDAQNE